MRAAAVRYGPVLALTLLGAVLRFPTLDRQSFWLDELVTASLLDRSLGDVLGEIPRTEATPYALLRRRLALELGLRARRGRAAIALRARGDRDDPGRVRSRRGPRVPAHGCRRSPRRDEPVPRLVLAGGSVVRAVRAARSGVGAHLRARPPWRPSLARGVVRGLRAHARHALLRGLPRRRGGRLAARAAAAAASRSCSRRSSRSRPSSPICPCSSTSVATAKRSRARRSRRGSRASRRTSSSATAFRSRPREASSPPVSCSSVSSSLRGSRPESGGVRLSQARSRPRSCSSRSCLAAVGRDYVIARNAIVAVVPAAVCVGAGLASRRLGVAAAVLLCALCASDRRRPGVRRDVRSHRLARRSRGRSGHRRRARRRRDAVHEPVALAPLPARAGRARRQRAPS